MRDTGPAATPQRVAASERRPLTILFADIAGSTAIAEKLDPEDWTVLVGTALSRLNAIAARYDGTVARLMGDGVLVFFGAPVAHEDDPERAVRCGLDMVRELAALGGADAHGHAVPLQVRVGINTGPVVVGMVGSDVAREYTATGDAGNVTSRLLAERREHVTAADARTTWIEGRCLSYGRGLPHQLIVELVRSAIGVPPSADEPEVRAALAARTKALLGADWLDAYVYLRAPLAAYPSGPSPRSERQTSFNP